MFRHLVGFVCFVAFCGTLSEALACKQRGETCRGLPRCCGDLVCTSEGKFNPFKGGTCGECASTDGRCVYDNQCCEGLQCDKEIVTYPNGFCKPPRPAGASCHRDSMCRSSCDKSWYQIYGECVG